MVSYVEIDLDYVRLWPEVLVYLDRGSGWVLRCYGNGEVRLVSIEGLEFVVNPGLCAINPGGFGVIEDRYGSEWFAGMMKKRKGVLAAYWGDVCSRAGNRILSRDIKVLRVARIRVALCVNDFNGRYDIGDRVYHCMAGIVMVRVVTGLGRVYHGKFERTNRPGSAMAEFAGVGLLPIGSQNIIII